MLVDSCDRPSYVGCGEDPERGKDRETGDKTEGGPGGRAHGGTVVEGPAEGDEELLPEIGHEEGYEEHPGGAGRGGAALSVIREEGKEGDRAGSALT